MKNADDFLKCFNNLEDWMRKTLRMSRHIPFSDLVSKMAERNRAVKNHEHFIRSMGNLRNAIVHDSQYPERLIATPNVAIINEFELICRDIYKPKTALQVCAKNPSVIRHDDHLFLALKLMREKDFSQIVVLNHDLSYSILTREGIACWVEANIQEDIVSLKDVKISDIMRFESGQNWKLISAKESIYDVLAYFSERRTRIQSLLISQNGRIKEKPLGIITFWDVSREITHA